MSTPTPTIASASWSDMVTRERSDIEAAAQQKTRSEDAARRAAALTVGIIDVAKLMRDLAYHVPTGLTDSERAGYLQAIRDISLHVNHATLEHDSAGELVERYVGIQAPPEIVDVTYKTRTAQEPSLT